MSEKICMITGANSGIGKAASIQIAARGYHVIMGCRSRARGETALEDVRAKSGSDAVDLLILDMSLQSSVREAARYIETAYDRLDVLIQNAAVFDITQKQIAFTEEGVETIWATNHLGPVLLTELLLDRLKQSPQSRIITVASKGLMAKPFLRVDLEDPEFRQGGFDVTKAYYQSKLAQIIYTYWLAQRLQGTGVTANCIRVPIVAVDTNRYPNMPGFLKSLYSLKTRMGLTPEQMAETYTYVATSDEVSEITGQYFDEKNRSVKSRRYTTDPETIARVMQLTMRFLDI